MIHNYFDVNVDVLWGTVKEDLPKLKQLIDALLNSYSIFTSGAYSAPAPNAAFPQNRGPRQASLLGWK
jgi:hypothetical protein